VNMGIYRTIQLQSAINPTDTASTAARSLPR
jgi:hypothetical protein